MGHHGNSFLSFGGVAQVGGWKELARTTLGATSDDIIVSSLADKRYYMFLISAVNSGNLRTDLQLGSGSTDTGNNYAFRYSETGATDITGATQSSILMSNGGTSTINNFMAGYIANLSAKEKLILGQTVNQNTAGEATAPGRREFVGKWVNTSNPLDVITAHNNNAGDFASGSEVVVLEWSPADTHTDNFWEQLASVELGGDNAELSSGIFTSKKYLWIQAYVIPTASNEATIRLGKTTIDTASNYATRRSFNGGADATFVNQTLIANQGGAFTTPSLFNFFILNISAKEKLVTGHSVMQSTAGAGNAPQRSEYVGKWDNVSDLIDIINIHATASTWAIGSFIKVWGSN